MGEQLYTIVMVFVMIGVMYFFMIRPESKRKKEAEAMRKALVVGDEVYTIGGICGTICAVKETTFVIETGADRVRLEVSKSSISEKNMASKK